MAYSSPDPEAGVMALMVRHVCPAGLVSDQSA
jgi:hypothetical protein